MCYFTFIVTFTKNSQNSERTESRFSCEKSKDRTLKPAEVVHVESHALEEGVHLKIHYLMNHMDINSASSHFIVNFAQKSQNSERTTGVGAPHGDLILEAKPYRTV